MEQGADVDRELDEPEEENLAVLSAEQAWAGVTSSKVPESDEEVAAAVGADAVFAPSLDGDSGAPESDSTDGEA